MFDYELERGRPERVFKVRKSDMSLEMQQAAVDTANSAMELSMNTVEIAKHIKCQFDKLFSPAWHCIVGPHFTG